MDAAVKSASPAWQKPLFDGLFRECQAARFGLSVEDFCCALREICGKQLPSAASREDTERYLRGLRLNELALARACAAGHDAAWTEFLTRYRGMLYQVALGITRDDSRGRELADSIYAELYGMKLREGVDGNARASKLLFYTGRGSLEGWLRTVLAQEHINRYRRERRLVSLEEETEAGMQFVAADQEP